MKLNYDLIRDTLIAIEEISDGHLNFDSSYLKEKHYLSDYDLPTIEYHVNQLSQGGYIQTVNGYIIDLTFEGHQYLANIRSDKIWTKTKNVIKPLGNIALSIVSDVAKKIILKELSS